MFFRKLQNDSIKILLCSCLINFNYNQKNNRVESKKVYICYTIIMCILLQIPYWYISVIYTGIIKDSAIKKSPVSDMVNIVQVWILELALMLAFSNGLLKRKCQVKLLNEILDIEEKAIKLKIPLSSSFNKIYLKKNKLRAGVLIFFMLAIGAKSWVLWGRTVYLLTLVYYVFCANIISALLIFMIVLVMMQEQLFKGINLNIKNFIEKDDFSNINELKELLRLHNQLYRTINLFSDSFGLFIASICFYMAGTQTCEIYLGPFVIFSMENIKTNQILFWDGIGNSFWMTPLLIILYLLASGCKKTINEAKNINKLCKTFDINVSKKIDDNLKEMVILTLIMGNNLINLQYLR